MLADDIARRRAALWRALPDDVRAVLVFGFGDALGAGTMSHGALRYLTGWNSHEAQSLAILTPQGCRLLVSSPFLAPPSDLGAQSLPSNRWGEAIAAHVGPSGPLATIGFGEMPHATHSTLCAALGGHAVTQADDILSTLRMVKSPTELASLTKGAALCDDLFDRLPVHMRSGEPVWKTQLRQETHARLSGADYCRTWLTVRPIADRPRYWPEENRNIPQDGDQVLFGIALTVNGYWAHGIRMGTVGPARAEHEVLWSIAHDALLAGEAALTPGCPVGDIETAMSGVVLSRTRGSADLRRFRNGHGLGVSYEDPMLSDHFPQHWGPEQFRTAPPDAQTIETGMVFELHPNLFIPGLGGAALGDMMTIEPAGARAMLHFPRRLFLS
ncbi:M24 family metallopeptidase [Roseobacter sp.]|uniref:M24 family metallopeptidase n=1 Tax=Roseobacter sp. TaxID=1907202 RepID=UPI0032980FA3